EEWASAGGQATGPQGGAVDVSQLGQAATGGQQTSGAEGAAPSCEIPNAHVVDVPVPAAGERLTLPVEPGDALRLACSYRDVHGTEVGNNLEMTFPDGGTVVVENFSEWIAAKGATISDCVCGGVNLADFVVGLGLNPEDVLPAAGGPTPQGPLGVAVDHPHFDAGPGPEILGSYDHPHILPPTGLEYRVPTPGHAFFPVEKNPGTVGEPTVTLQLAGVDTCVEEDSTLFIGEGVLNPDNIVTVTAAVGEPNDELTQIVITGLQSDWEYDFNGLNQPGVQS